MPTIQTIADVLHVPIEAVIESAAWHADWHDCDRITTHVGVDLWRYGTTDWGAEVLSAEHTDAVAADLSAALLRRVAS